MKKLLLTTVAALAFAGSAHAAVIRDIGINPTSAQGDFRNSVGGAAFEDYYTFQLVGAEFITFASATNVFTNPTDFIANFTGQLFSQVGAPGGGDDIAVSAPVAAVPCPTGGSFCQVLAGAALLDAGSYYLQVSGAGGGTSGYGGNLTTASVVPIPGLALAVPFGALGLGWLARRRRQLAG